MKKSIMLLAAVILTAGISQAYGQTGAVSSQPAQDQQMMHRWQGKALELSKELNLSDGQKTQIRDILKQRHAQVQEIFQTTANQIDAVLTPEQKAKLDQLREKGREKMQQMRKERREKRTGENDTP